MSASRAAIVWAAVQFMQLFGVLGISNEPPGLVFLVDYPDPPPPPIGTVI